MAHPASEGEQVLVVAPVGRDGELLQSLFLRAGYGVLSPSEGAEMPLEDLDAVVLTLEALETHSVEHLLDRLDKEPSWSDLPLVLLGEQDALASLEVVQALHIHRNVTMVPRPTEPAVLLSAVAAALRDRRRQREMRNLLRRVVAQNLQLAQEVARREQVEEALQQARAQLAVRVEQKSGQLVQTSAALAREIDDHAQTRRQLDAVRRQIHFGREADWMRLAQILYDETIQQLSGLLYEIKGLGKQIAKNADQEGRIDLIHAHLVDVIQHLRVLANQRRASVFREFGLAKAMRAYAEHFQTQDALRIAFFLADEPSPLPQEIDWELYRIYQQALQNAAAHAHARAVLVRLQYNADTVVLEVEDDGTGFSMSTDLIALAQSGHLGIASMIERTEGIGGIFEIDTRPHQGTRIRITIPRAENTQIQRFTPPPVWRNGHLLRSL